MNLLEWRLGWTAVVQIGNLNYVVSFCFLKAGTCRAPGELLLVILHLDML